MSEQDLTSIPLPLDMESKGLHKKTAKQMLQEALKDHKQSSKKETGTSTKLVSNKLATALGPKIKMTTTSTANRSSQSIVDELFKDFISQRLSSTRDNSSVSTEVTPSQEGNYDELSKILDMEISSIQSHNETRESCEKDRQSSLTDADQISLLPAKRPRSKSSGSSSKRKRHRSDEQSSFTSETKETNNEELPKNLHSFPAQQSHSVTCDQNQEFGSSILLSSRKTHARTSVASNSQSDSKDMPTSDSKIKVSSEPCGSISQSLSSVHPDKSYESHSIKKNIVADEDSTGSSALPSKKVSPKMLGMKLSTESLSLIKSTDRIDRDGRVWEEGEVPSGESDKNITESESESDGYPSETGSINSNEEEWKTHMSKKKKKHKHKHKHKKKKKKSSKNQDSDSKEKSRNRGSKDGDQDKLRSKDKDSSKVVDKKTDSRERDRVKSKSKNKIERESEEHQLSAEKKTDRGRDRSKGGKTERDSESKHRSRERSRDKSAEKQHEKSREKEKRKRSRSRSFSPRRHKNSKSRSRSPPESSRGHKNWASDEKSHYNEWDARRYSDKHSKYSKKDESYSRSHSHGKLVENQKRSKDRSKSRERDHDKDKQERDLRLQIDKAKLRRIAIANALQNMKSGQGPQVDITALKSGGKSVQELTEFCKRIAEKSKSKQESELTDSSDEDVAHQSDDDDLPIHHPFKVKDSSTNSIVMNIRNAKQLPVLTPSEKQAQQAALRLTFPVSSGSHHRASESEWVPVEKTTAQRTPVTLSAPTVSQAVIEAPPQVESKRPESIFPDPTEAQKIDIGSIISERLQAVRKLQENPYDVQALSKMHQVQEQASKWATSKHLPGQFLGSTGAQILSQEELIGDKRHQAWARKTQLSHAAPVNGGIGMFLLQKMGWKQGEGLGKHNEGSKEPLMLDVKVDRKGLTTATEGPKIKPCASVVPRAKDLSNKHPVSALMELCNRRRWGPPVFTVVDESGPDHKKNFLFKVKVNNVEYQPCVPSSNKKTAKAQCAAVCLQEMGLIPRDAPLNI